jgi:hypothetical protein
LALSDHLLKMYRFFFVFFSNALRQASILARMRQLHGKPMSLVPSVTCE